jgi:hypothetical protein
MPAVIDLNNQLLATVKKVGEIGADWKLPDEFDRRALLLSMQSTSPLRHHCRLGARPAHELLTLVFDVSGK